MLAAEQPSGKWVVAGVICGSWFVKRLVASEPRAVDN